MLCMVLGYWVLIIDMRIVVFGYKEVETLLVSTLWTIKVIVIQNKFWEKQTNYEDTLHLIDLCPLIPISQTFTKE